MIIFNINWINDCFIRFYERNNCVFDLFALYFYIIYPLSLQPKFLTIGNKVFKGNLSLLVRINAFIASF